MHRNYLLELLQTLSAEELDEFQLFLESPYHNRAWSPPEVVVFFYHIRETLEAFRAQPGTASALFPVIYKKSGWETWKIDKALSALAKLLPNFLLLQSYLADSNEFQKQLDFGRILYIRGFDERFTQILERLRGLQQQQTLKNTDYFYRQYRVELAQYERETNFNRKKGDLNIPAVLHQLDAFFYSSRLELVNYLILQTMMANLELPESLRTSPILEVPAEFLAESAPLQIEYRIYRLLVQAKTTQEDFIQMANLLRSSQAELEKLEQYYSYLRNLCVLLINAGEENLLPVLHRIQKENLEHGFLYYTIDKEQHIHPSALLNLITVSIRVGQASWGRQVLENHQGRIIGDNDSRDLYRLNLACCLFAAGRFREALDYIPPSSPYVDYQLTARRLEIKIYYELDDDLLPYKVDAFKMYISRASKKFLSAGLRQRNAEFVNLVFQILQSAKGDKGRAERLYKRIQEKKQAADRDWLLEKARMLG